MEDEDDLAHPTVLACSMSGHGDSCIIAVIAPNTRCRCPCHKGAPRAETAMRTEVVREA